MDREENMFQSIIDLSRKAFAGQQFSVSYHLLSAAMHCASDEKDAAHLALVAQLATEQLAVIDANHPEYEHSTLSSQKRGHENIFVLMARQAKTKEHLLQVKHLPQARSE